MIEFDKFYVVVKKYIPKLAQCQSDEIPGRLFSPETVCMYTYMDKGQNREVRLEFDGKTYWRVLLSETKAPDGVKEIAFVIGAVRYCDIKAKVHPMKAGKIANAIMNERSREYRQKYPSKFTERVSTL